MHLSTTAFGEASICLARYDYHQNQHLVPAPRSLSPRIRLGLWIHRALEYASSGRAWLDALHECAEWAVAHGVPKEKADEVFFESQRILAGYLAYWGQSSRWAWTVLACEEVIEHAVSPTLTLKATVDKVVRWRGQLWLVEHKSTQEIPSAAWRATDPQTALQYAVCKLSGKYDIAGIIFDYLVTREPPIPRVKNDGRFYAGTEKMTTTEAAWREASQDVLARWSDKTESVLEYLGNMRERIVNDGHFYQRFEVYRPDAAVIETLKDVRATQEMILLSEKLQHWRRLNNLLYCQRFCSYATICSAEYVSGRVSQGLRADDYVIEDDNDREGRDQIPQRGARGSYAPITSEAEGTDSYQYADA